MFVLGFRGALTDLVLLSFTFVIYCATVSMLFSTIAKWFVHSNVCFHLKQSRTFTTLRFLLCVLLHATFRECACSAQCIEAAPKSWKNCRDTSHGFYARLNIYSGSVTISGDFFQPFFFVGKYNGGHHARPRKTTLAQLSLGGEAVRTADRAVMVWCRDTCASSHQFSLAQKKSLNIVTLPL